MTEARHACEAADEVSEGGRGRSEGRWPSREEGQARGILAVTANLTSVREGLIQGQGRLPLSPLLWAGVAGGGLVEGLPGWCRPALERSRGGENPDGRASAKPV